MRRGRSGASCSRSSPALLLGVLVAVARESLRPALPDAATLSRVAGVPLIAALPAAPETGSASSSGACSAVRLAPRGRRPDGHRGGGAAGRGPRRPAAARPAGRARPRDRRPRTAPPGWPTASRARWPGAVMRRCSSASTTARDGRREPAADIATLLCTDIDEQLEELRGTDYRYVVVESPRSAAARRLRPLAARSTAVVLVARLGRARTADAAAARRLIEALGLRGLGAGRDLRRARDREHRADRACPLRCGLRRARAPHRTTARTPSWPARRPPSDAPKRAIADKPPSNGRCHGRPMRRPYGRPVTVFARWGGPTQPRRGADRRRAGAHGAWLAPRRDVLGRRRCAGRSCSSSSWRPSTASAWPCSASARSPAAPCLARRVAAQAVLLPLMRHVYRVHRTAAGPRRARAWSSWSPTRPWRVRSTCWPRWR